jgi:Lrp/AsnC family leucine-responsive transcriptional regulator
VKLTQYAEELENMSLRDLDATDHKILSVLQVDGRISNLELAQKVGLSPTPCSRRVRRLEQSSIITGYGAKVDLSNQREGITVQVSIRLAGQKPEDIDAFTDAVNQIPEITECLLVTGNVDYLLTVQTDSVDGLRDFVLSKLKNIPCVSETTTMLILGSIKSR